MSRLEHFRTRLRNPQHTFADTLNFIAHHYDYQPSAFRNGDINNAAGENEGSCKTLGLALLEKFSTEEALLAFGEHYRAVQQHPTGQDHRNIRTLMAQGLSAVSFEQPPLRPKTR